MRSNLGIFFNKQANEFFLASLKTKNLRRLFKVNNAQASGLGFHNSLSKQFRYL